ncbi:MAG: bacillithiol system redox-active protein YtxJ [Bacteroidetes bacterium]|nr:bacillithiol system redox-active protein YtxJ [Bacteroidota bacterium]
MNWNRLTDVAQLEEIKEESRQYPVLLFKHSTRCSISATTLRRLERDWNEQEVGNLKPYYLDLIAYRPISNKIAEEFDVWHESPQAILIRNGESVFDASHYDVTFDAIKEQVAS